MDRDEKRRVPQLPSPDESQTIHESIRKEREEGTGDWVLKSASFQYWWRGRGSPILWGHGIPGSGKTFICSTVIDFLKETKPRDGNKTTGVAFIYFNYRERKKQNSRYVLDTLVNQLTEKLAVPLQSSKNSRGGPIRHSLVQLYGHLETASKEFARVFFVVDALDECPPVTRLGLIPLLNYISKIGRIFLTSRPHTKDIQSAFFSASKIELFANPDDISTYVKRRIDRASMKSRIPPNSDIEARVISGMIQSSQGMFLLVRFHCEIILRQPTSKALWIALGDIERRNFLQEGQQSSLDHIYDTSIHTIREQSVHFIKLAFCILLWLTKARRPLLLGELQVAIMVERGRYELDEFDLADKSTILDLCHDLVEIEPSNLIRFSHHTVREYLLGKDLLPGDANFQIAATCISYLSFDVFDQQGACDSEELFNSRLAKYPFLSYAALYLFYHLQSCDEGLLVDLILRFLERKGSISTYLQVNHVLNNNQGASVFNEYPKKQCPLHIASKLGNWAVVELLLEKEDSISVCDDDGRTALCLAASEGHAMVVIGLLDSGADSSIADKDGRTALHWAAYEGHERIVLILLEDGGHSQISVQDKNEDTPQRLAELRGCGAIVRLLRNRTPGGAKPRVQPSPSNIDCSVPAQDSLQSPHNQPQTGHGNTAHTPTNEGMPAPEELEWMEFSSVVSRQDEEAIQKLLQIMTNLSVKDKYGQTLLYRAAYSGYEKGVQIIFDKGTDTSITANDRDTALWVAAANGHEGIVRLLLKKGADQNVISDGWTPLYRAAFNGHEPVVRLLLTSAVSNRPQPPRAFFDKDSYERTPLQRAAFNGHEIIVTLLLELKPDDLSYKAGDGRTILSVAASAGNDSMVRLLLGKTTALSKPDKAAWITTPDNNGRTALHWAILKGYGPVFELLFSQWIGIAAVEKDSLLSLAASRGHKSMVHTLLEKGASIATKDKCDRTPLHLAAFGGHEDVVQLLVDKRAVISALDRFGRTPLYLAASEGHTGVVQIFLDAGANLSIRAKDGKTALRRAISDNQVLVAVMLLKKTANFAFVGEDGKSLLSLAATEGRGDITRHLLQYGADPAVRDTHLRTPLHLAASGGHQEVVQLLIDRGVDISALDKFGRTPLYQAASEGHTVVVQILLGKGADASIETKDKSTALSRAECEGHTVMIEELKRALEYAG